MTDDIFWQDVEVGAGAAGIVSLATHIKTGEKCWDACFDGKPGNEMDR